MKPDAPLTHLPLPADVTRTAVQSVSWWNPSNQPLQDNQPGHALCALPLEI
jgi:hypothetical protein